MYNIREPTDWYTFLLTHFQIVGLATNTKFLDDLAGHQEFEKAKVHTGFIDQYYNVSIVCFFKKKIHSIETSLSEIMFM